MKEKKLVKIGKVFDVPLFIETNDKNIIALAKQIIQESMLPCPDCLRQEQQLLELLDSRK